MNEIGFDSLLCSNGFNAQAQTRMVRHKDSRFDMEALLNAGHFETYQAYQSDPIFNCRWVASFVGDQGTRARFVGLYEVLGCLEPGSAPSLPSDFPSPAKMAVSTDYYYDLKKDTRCSHLENRVVIEWGKGTRSWCQRYRDREVIEILPSGYVREFPGYLDFVLTYIELSEIVRSPAANREWHRSLSAIAGVYLITDNVTGAQYVGSAYGKDGVLGRWREYAKRPDGGNLLLGELIRHNPGRERHFSFTLLQALDKSLSRKEVFAHEIKFKRKLGSRAFGLNAN